MGLRILVVDDDPVLGDLFRDVLGMQQHSCEVAKTAVAALDLLAQEQFDLVISDLRMPGLSGMELWEKLQDEHPRLAGNMIFVSAEDPASPTCGFVRTSGLGYLKKPFKIQELSLAVARAVPGTVQA